MDGSDDRIKTRMDQRLGQLHWSLVDLAEATDESYRNVHRWIREEVKVPAHFVARFAATVPVNPRWLLSGEGTPDPVTESTAQIALERIAHVLDSVRITSSTGLLAESVIDSSFDGILAYDQDLRYTLWNPAMERITGVARLAVLGKSVFDVFPDLRGTEVEEHLRAPLDGEVRTVEERPYSIPEIERDGWYEARYEPLRDGSGTIVGGLCVCREVTDRKEAELLRQEAEGRLRSLLELCREPAFLHRDGRVVEATESLAELARCSGPDELEGAALDEIFVSDDDAPDLPDAFDDVGVGERIGPLPARLSRRDGSRLDVEVVAAGVRVRNEPAAQGLVRVLEP